MVAYGRMGVFESDESQLFASFFSGSTVLCFDILYLICLIDLSNPRSIYFYLFLSIDLSLYRSISLQICKYVYNYASLSLSLA